MKWKIIILFLSLNIILFNCGKGEEKDVSKIPFHALQDSRENATAPEKLKDGYNFSVKAPDAKYVSLVGDFNNWIDNRTPMHKNKYGVWAITIPIKKGIYSYKFNLDGVWIIDANNTEIAKDKLGDKRSIIEVKEETPFYEEPIYSGYINAFAPMITESGVLFSYDDKYAQKVFVAGTFNNWEKEEFPLQKNKNGIWSGYVQIAKGEYYYKFVVDRIWKYDLNNPEKMDDGSGDYKSKLIVSLDIQDRPDKPYVINYDIIRFKFYNKDLPSKYNISVIGSFNDWQPNIDIMVDSGFNKEWYTTKRLLPGEYYYKFYLEGKEFFDPENNNHVFTPEEKEANYLKVIIPPDKYNVKFSYFNKDAKSVKLIGDFNNWDPEVDSLQKDQFGLWYIVKQLSHGSYVYQYIIDNKWILDPNNPVTKMDMNGKLNSYLEVK